MRPLDIIYSMLYRTSSRLIVNYIDSGDAVPGHRNPEQRLRELGYQLPHPPPPVAMYQGAVRIGDFLFLSGHGPLRDGERPYRGKLGRDLGVEDGQASAQIVTLNALATAKAELGSLDRITRFVKLLVFVNSDPEFISQHLVADGASKLIKDVFGPEVGAHARSAVGIATLPFGISVEIEMVLAVTST
jgi:enamine deaminase RidA (YjgF/YER057c/UK114 family)